MKLLTTIRQTNYAFSRQKLNEVIKMLRDCSTENLIKLPKIAVIGNQSAGKSSLIEAISQIKVPRASGTCTRCPMEVILRRSDQEWHGKVSLRLENVDELILFAETKVREDITIFLRRAQLAALNPNEPVENFKNLECDKYDVAQKFSRNTVVLEISGADVDVTFIDLPGIISNTENTDEGHLIELIRDLAISYVSQEECLILMAISMKDDIDNQSAAKISKEYDPNGIRTIGVLTKADTVQEGDFEQWIKILNNERHILRRGYYSTRLPGPSSKEMGQTWEQAREAEKRFFGHKQWSQFKNRLGIENLTEALSVGLAEMIDARLPGLKKELTHMMRNVQRDVDLLPQSFSDDPQTKLLGLCSDFVLEIGEHVKGNPNYPKFLQDLDEGYHAMAEEIAKTRPDFEIKPRSTIIDPIMNLPALRVPLAIPPQNIPGPPPVQMEPVIRPEGKDTKPVISLGSVRDVIQQKSIRELPGIIPFSVHEHYIDMFASKWKYICLDSFGGVEQILKELLERLCRKYFERFRSAGLLHEIDAVTCEVLAKAAKHTREHIELHCGMESYRPFTMNYADYAVSKEKFLTEFAHRRNGKPLPSAQASSSRHTLRDTYGNSQSVTFKGESDDALLSLLTANGFPVTSMKQLARLHEPDEYEAELNVMTEVLAYFEISTKRIVDIMPMIFETVFARKFENDLRKVLTSKLKLVGDSGLENCAKYVVDEPDVQLKREKFDRHKMILSNALGIVSRLFN